MADPIDGKSKSTWDLKQGDELVPGRFVMKKLGGGRVYEVYIVWDEEMACLLVAKVVRPDHVENAHSMKGLRREAKMVESLAHPLIVRSFGVVLDGPRPHLLLEHLEGRDLRSVIRYGSIGLEQLLPLALNICSALHYMAAKGVVHLDVKSRNIVMGVPPRLIDLSLARSIPEAAALKVPVGTDAYMAPEQCAPGARGEIGSPADIWGLGATLYRATNGRVPWPRPDGFDRGKREERFPQLVREPDPFNKEVPSRIADIILAALQPDPEARPDALSYIGMLEELVAKLPRKPILRRARPGHR